MIKLSQNKKLNGVLNAIYEDLTELGLDEVKRYYNEFKYKPDYNIVEYANLLIYFDDIRELYKQNGYLNINGLSDQKIWSMYKNQVGYVTRYILENIERN